MFPNILQAEVTTFSKSQGEYDFFFNNTGYKYNTMGVYPRFLVVHYTDSMLE